jgi:DNA-binding response OmpR family regulator
MTKKVLVCDDEPYIVESVSYVVRKAGYEVAVAEDGMEALTTARRERPDLIFLDIMMPRLSGQEVCRQLGGSDTKAPTSSCSPREGRKRMSAEPWRWGRTSS